MERRYQHLARKFYGYISDKKGCSFNVVGKDKYGEFKEINIPYVHRWTSYYLKRTLRRLYSVQKWQEEQNKPITMLTLTVYHRRRTVEEAFSNLRAGLRHLLLYINRFVIKGHLDYFWVIEPHKSGYPHIHVCCFCVFTEDQQEQIKRYWVRNLKVGGYEGVNFIQLPEFTNIKNYLLKYLAKTFFNPDNLEENFKFALIVWNKRMRLLGFSRGISRTFPKLEKQFSEVDYVDMLDYYGNSQRMYKRDV